MPDNRKKILLFAILCALTLTLLFISLESQLEEKMSQNEGTKQSDYYTIKEYDGRIAVFKNTDKAPQKVYDSYISVLPEADRERLRKGILTDNTAELQKIIEDYTS